MRAEKAVMLTGTDINDSSRLRAVTRISCNSSDAVSDGASVTASAGQAANSARMRPLATANPRRPRVVAKRLPVLPMLAM